MNQIGFVLFMLLLVACNQPEQSDFTQLNYYHWGQNFDFSPYEQAILKHSKSQKLYVRFFDVQWSDDYEAPVPVSTINFSQIPTEIEVVPTIYITNDEMQRLSRDNEQDKKTVKAISVIIFLMQNLRAPMRIFRQK